MDLRERIREGAKGVPKTRRMNWAEPTAADFVQGCVLAFDQTVTKTGWALVANDSALHVINGGILLAPPVEGVKGFEGTLLRAVTMSVRITNAVQFPLGYGVATNKPMAIVHEMPSIVGWRIESSLMGAMAVRQAAAAYRPDAPVQMISKMSTSALLVPPHLDRTSKAEVKVAVNKLIPDYMRRTSCWTQDVSDAVALALTYLHRRNHASYDE